jgi:uncharacterized membrane protein YdbT with pleckstrin-like domain
MFDLRHLPNPIANEKLVYFLRRHPVTLFPLAVGFCVLILLPILVAMYFWLVRPLWMDGPFFPLFVLGGSIFFLFAWLFLFQSFLDYYLDIWIVTTKRILNIEQTGLFGRTVSELRLYRIQDVTATVHGILHTFLNFGNVHIQTAAEKERFVFEEVPHPNEVAKMILELSEIDRKEHLDEAVEEFGMPDHAHPKSPDDPQKKA